MTEQAKKKKVFDGRYEILGIVGRGRKSVVYRAKNIVDGGPEVALKVLIADPKEVSSTRDKLRKEALAMVSSHHKFVVRLDDFHSVGDLSYLSMEFAPESDLRKYVSKSGGKLNEDLAKRFLTQAAKALDYIHSVGIIHRDIKPDNILVMNDQEIRIGDFGLALLPGDTQSPDEYQNAVGTMDYMAPELLEGRPCSIRTDLYALGVTFIELVTGKQPFSNTPISKQDEARRSIQNIDGLPASLRDILLALVQYEPTDRPKNAKELLAAIADPSILKNTPSPEQKRESVGHSPKPAPIAESAPKQVEEPKQLNIEETQVIQLVPQAASKQGSENKGFKKEKDSKQPLVTPGLSLRLLSRIFVGLAMFLLGLKVFSTLFIVKEPISNESQVEESSLDLRTASSDGVIDLARLPTGRYRGEITGIHPALESAPFFIISDLENGTLIVSVGIEGWKPKVVNTIGQEIKSLALSGGGILIEVDRLITNDGIRVVGSTRNRSLNKSGTLFFEVVK
jgi:serine/threonine protein kinase